MSSPRVPGARPSNLLDDSTLMCCRTACGSTDGKADMGGPAGAASFVAGAAGVPAGAGGGLFSFRPQAAARRKTLQIASETTTLRMICHFMRILIVILRRDAVRETVWIR